MFPSQKKKKKGYQLFIRLKFYSPILIAVMWFYFLLIDCFLMLTVELWQALFLCWELQYIILE